MEEPATIDILHALKSDASHNRLLLYLYCICFALHYLGTQTQKDTVHMYVQYTENPVENSLYTKHARKYGYRFDSDRKKKWSSVRFCGYSENPAREMNFRFSLKKRKSTT